jgi:hypothetical protein
MNRHFAERVHRYRQGAPGPSKLFYDWNGLNLWNGWNSLLSVCILAGSLYRA